MKERLAAVGRFLAGILKALWRALLWLLRGVGRLFSGWSRGAGTKRAIRAEERQRREAFENLGKMVYLLYKRNLVRNSDLLTACHQVVQHDARIDQLQAELAHGRVEPQRGEAVRLAAQPAEQDAAVSAS